MKLLRRYGLDAGIISLALLLQIVALPQRWIEAGYANGMYAALERTFVPLANAVPFALGDLLLSVLVLGVLTWWVFSWRRRGRSGFGLLATLLIRSATLIALVGLWFDGAWALNYRRLPIVRRVAFDPARLTPRDVAAFSARIAACLNATAPFAHADHQTEGAMETSLATAFAPVVGRLGDRYDVIVSRPKRTLFNWWFGVAGIGGMWDPFAYETIVNADFLPFERPFAIAHEWGHVAGFGDEGDANLIAALTTLRARDPLIRYSGLFWAYGFLPENARRPLPLSPLVRADLDAAQRRFLRFYNPKVYALQWFIYDKYLRANRVSRGVVSYSLFVQVLVGTPLDAAGLPLVRPAGAGQSRTQPPRVLTQNRAPGRC